MPRARFGKYEGSGNDFIVLDVARIEDFDPKTVPLLCDRRLGIGADGVLLVLPPKDQSAGARMLVLNADGSVPEMCGNGLRCVALHLARTRDDTQASVLVETDSGTRACSVRRGGSGAAEVRVDMGIVRVLERGRLLLAAEAIDVAVVDAGNPHAVVFRDDPRADLPRLGPQIALHSFFPSGTNVELVRQRGPDAFDVFVWERGVGPTLACGTGACAVVAEAFASGLVTTAAVTVHLPGGALLVTHEATTGKTELEGPARLVFEGELPELGT